MYGEIKKNGINEDEIKNVALKLIQLVARNPKFNASEQGNVDFEAIHKEAQIAIDMAMEEVVNPKLVLPTKAKILEVLRQLEL